MVNQDTYLRIIIEGFHKIPEVPKCAKPVFFMESISLYALLTSGYLKICLLFLFKSGFHRRDVDGAGGAGHVAVDN